MSKGPEPDRSATPVRVVMVVANEVTPDTRVKKMAASVARAGFDVTILGQSKSGYEWHTQMGDVRILRVPLAPTYRSLDRERKEADLRLAYRRARRRRARRRAKTLEARRTIENREFQALATMRKEALETISHKHKDELARWLDRSSRPRLARVAASQWMQLRRWAAMLPVKFAARYDRLRMRLLRRRARIAVDRLERAERAYTETLTKTRTRGPAGARWRDALPELHDYEIAFGRALEDLQPDIIHAHDMHTIGIAARAAARLRGRGHEVKWLYDAHEYVRGLDNHMPAFRWRAYVELQDEYISEADGVITVSEPLADFLVRDHELEDRPTVVLNAPMYEPRKRQSTPTIRERIGLPRGIPLLVYSGRIHESRGVDTLVRALEYMPDVHIALVSGQATRYVEELHEIAEQLHAGSRLHLVDYVPSEEVVHHLSTATVGVNLLIDCLNHEVALPNKFFEYLHAGLPILNSDVGASAQLVRARGIGATFETTDPEDLASAATSLLAQLDRYRDRVVADADFLADMSWQAQEQRLLGAYADLTGRDVAVLPEAPPLDLTEREGLPVVARDAAVRLVIGPHNMAGQGMAWTRALRRASNEVYTEVHAIRRGGNQLSFDADVPIPIAAWKSTDWQRRQLDRILADFTHVVFEGGSPMAGGLIGSFFTAELPVVQHHGIQVALLFHGSDIRDPRRHREMEPHSPFGNDGLTRDLQRRVDRLRPQVDAFNGPIFVSTSGLLDYVPRAQWLPVVVDVNRWSPPVDRPALATRIPTVMHVSTNSRLKGGTETLEVCQRLHEEGLLNLVQPGRVEPPDLPAVMERVDVYIDGTVLGDYGVTATQAMAMNRLVIGNVSARVRDRIPEPVPILQADPSDLEDVLRKVCDDPAAFRPLAEAGRDFVTRFHDGSHSADVLRPFLGI